MAAGSPRYQASGSALITRSGISGWAKKNQCHHSVANRASARARCSLIGMQSNSARRVTTAG